MGGATAHWILHTYIYIYVYPLYPPHYELHSRKLTWNLKITCLKRKIIFQTSIFACHVSFRGSKRKRRKKKAEPSQQVRWKSGFFSISLPPSIFFVRPPTISKNLNSSTKVLRFSSNCCMAFSRFSALCRMRSGKPSDTSSKKRRKVSSPCLDQG